MNPTRQGATSSDVAEVVIPSHDGTPLRARFWPGRESQGLLVIAHGLGEHGGAYAHVAQILTEHPGLVDVLAFDFRGHGISPGRRGVVRRYEELTCDLRAAVGWASRQRPDHPRFVLGHSNGGQVALRAVLEGDLPIDGLVLSNPSLRLAVDIPRHKLWIGQVLRRVAPGLTLHGELPDEMLSRHPDYASIRRADTLRHTRVSAPLFFGMVEGGPAVTARAGEIHLPVLMLLGEADPVVDHRASLDLFERLGSPDKTLKLYPEALHEPLNDLDREQVLDDLRRWLAHHLRPSPGGNTSSTS